MKPKSVLSIGLLMFVGASGAVLVVKALRPGCTQPAAASAAIAAEASHGQAAEPLREGITVYYFHGNTRCPTCQKIEAWTRESVDAGFADLLASGKLRWQAINYEAPGNEHFATRYQLVAPLVVLVETQGGSQQQWKGLDRVWELVFKSKEAFAEYVQGELRAMLADQPAAAGESP